MVVRLTAEEKEDVELFLAGVQHGGTEERMGLLLRVLQSIEFEPYQPPKRFPVRLPIPAELRKEVSQVVRETGHSIVHVLLQAIRKSNDLYHS